MVYTIRWKKMPSKALIREEFFENLDEAMDEANFAMIGGSACVEVSVIDDVGTERFLHVHSNRRAV